MSLAYGIMALVTAQRFGELLLSARNTRALRARGAIEFGAGHYPVMVSLHAAWLVALWLSVGGRSVSIPLLGIFILLQALRLWVLSTLSARWTTRIIVLPGAPLVTRGPFRWLRHPNYCVVVGEIAILPLAFGLVGIALLFSLLNAAMLWVRIRIEHRALYGGVVTDDDLPIPGLRTWIGFIAMCLGMFMAILDVQIVATSLPTIQHALGVPADQMSWVQTAYLTAEIVAIPLTGYLTATLGMRRLFVIAVAVFSLASFGCAQSQGFASLLAWRVLQGFAGGTLIPGVFSAVFLLFPARSQGLATTIAGVAAVLAPTVGPVVGGWLTATYSWHWLFRVNIMPGIVAAIGAGIALRGGANDRRLARAIDLLALGALALGLTAFEIGLKDAPKLGWSSLRVTGLMAVFGLCAVLFTVRTCRSARPLVELRCFADRNFAVGCMLSFLLGISLFGSTYLMPFFLGLVREHDALRIGEIMLATGIAQLLSAPVAVFLERRTDVRVLSAFGFALFAAGLLLSAHQTRNTDAAQMLLPQILRGAAIMFCLLPPTRMALGNMPERLVADASGLFNLMRNFGGAVGLALIDTTIFSRAHEYAGGIVRQLQAGDVATAVGIGIPRDAFVEQIGVPLDGFTREMLLPLVERAALVHGINDAWLLIGLFTASGLPLILFARRRG